MKHYLLCIVCWLMCISMWQCETNDKMYDIVYTLDNINHTLNQFLIHYATKN